ncbi:amino acid ABC transporter permease [Salinicola corii]|uniref:Amino acid ABC transporter permease n=1 Tax=Salinicola corii TaxID=2606937 RepID=A0A640WFK8_9GAMM|nr:amino acid ABC transporter permease [Salinicola corii]KAA0019049.1 amino acid ABC transporter permease [Salinicola corii]
MDNFVDQFFNLDLMWQSLPLLMKGLGVTLQICVVVIVLGGLGGLLLAVASDSRRLWLRWPTIVYVDFFRAVPPLVLLIFVYSGMPFAGVNLSPYAAVILAFLLNNSAYYSEVYRAGLQSIPPGQIEASRSTGMSRLQTMTWVVMPQAVRNVLPDLLSNTVEVVKLTSLASVASLGDLLYRADMTRSMSYNSSPIVLAALIYLILLWPLVRMVSRFERKQSQ